MGKMLVYQLLHKHKKYAKTKTLAYFAAAVVTKQ